MIGPESGYNVDSGAYSRFHGQTHPHKRKSSGNGTIFRFVWRYSRGFKSAFDGKDAAVLDRDAAAEVLSKDFAGLRVNTALKR
jgi:hypothetical protein